MRIRCSDLWIADHSASARDVGKRGKPELDRQQAEQNLSFVVAREHNPSVGRVVLLIGRRVKTVEPPLRQHRASPPRGPQINRPV